MLFFRLVCRAVGLLLIFLNAATVLAQEKVYRSGAVWPELQVEYVFKNTSFLYFRNQYRHNLDDRFNHLRETEPLNHLERIQFRAGYERAFSPQWSGGIAEAYAFERTRRILFNELYVRHTGNIKGFGLTERASFEHIARWGQENMARARVRADLDRNLKFGRVNIRPRIAYELFFNYDYHQEAALKELQRNVDRTRLRLEIACSVNPYFTIIPFYIKQTDYLKVEPMYNPDNVVIRPGGKQNHITPIFGVDLRYTIFAGGKPFSRTIQPGNESN